MATCPFKDLFGAPRTGVHSLRFMGIAVVDTALTIVGAAVIARAIHQPFWIVFLILFIVGEIMHVAMCVDSTVARLLK
jgi:hypothetical protein